MSGINGDLLFRLFEKVAKEKLMMEIHQWIIHTAPPQVLEIYKQYLETKDEGKQQED